MLWWTFSPVDTTCDSAFVCEHPRYSPLVLGSGTADESRVVNDAILWSVALGLESPEEGLRQAFNERRHKRKGKSRKHRTCPPQLNFNQRHKLH